VTEPLQVGQFAIVDHEPVERGPNAGVFRGKGPADDRSELYVVAEGTTPAGDAFVGHLLSTLGQAWATYDLSLTGALQRLFAEAGRDLRDWNRKSIAQHRVRIGMTCLARRGNQAVLAQSGPTGAYFWHNNECKPLVPENDSAEPLGGPQDTPLTLVRIDMQPGDRLLLVSTSAMAELDDELLCGILSLPEDQVLGNLFRRVDHVRNMSALLVARGEEQQKQLPPRRVKREDPIIDATSSLHLPPGERPASPDPGGPFQPSLFIEQPGASAVTAAREQLLPITPRASISAAMPAIDVDVPEPLRRVSGDDSFAQFAAERGNRAALAASSHSLRIQPANVYNNEPGRMIDPGSRSKRRASFSRSLSPSDLPQLPDPEESLAPNVAELAADRQAMLIGPTWVEPLLEAGESMASTTSLVRVRNQMAPRWKSGGGSGHRIDLHPYVRRPWLVVAIGLLLFLGIVGYFVLPNLLSEQSTKRYARLVDGAQQQMAVARVQQDPAARRTALTSAQALLLEARDAAQAGPEVQKMLGEVSSSIAAMDNILAPSAIEVVANLEQFGDRPVAAARLVAGKDEAYILDTASGQVIAIGLADGKYRAVFSESAEQKRGRPTAIALLENSDLGSQALVIADASRNVWVYSNGAPLRLLALPAPANFHITDIATLGRDLYVLDSGTGSIYKFASSDSGFTSQPVKVVDNASLAKARRLAVDGEILTADEDGSIHRYSGQLSLALSQAGIDKPLVSDQTPQVIGKNGDIALADNANDRIVVLKRDGTFDRQYRHKDFAKMSAMAVRQDVVYVFSGGILRKVTF
jgi:hypothetical protein